MNTVAMAVAAPVRQRGESLWRKAARKFGRDRIGMLALGVVLVYFVTALGVWLGWWAGGWGDLTGVKWEPASREHWFGTNIIGQDIFDRAIYSTATAFEVGLVVALVATAIGAVLGALLPEDAIVVDESVSTGRGLFPFTASAPPHDWLNNMGGSIGFGLPVAVGAAIACPNRKVVSLEGDGSGMYTLQALWTMAREGLNVTIVVLANQSYAILKGEFANVGAGAPGQKANDMMSLDRPNLDWIALARGHGIEAGRAHDLQEFAREFQRALAVRGPYLIELMMV